VSVVSTTATKYEYQNDDEQEHVDFPFVLAVALRGDASPYGVNCLPKAFPYSQVLKQLGTEISTGIGPYG
jgi:hypothetical protein